MAEDGSETILHGNMWRDVIDQVDDIIGSFQIPIPEEMTATVNSTAQELGDHINKTASTLSRIEYYLGWAEASRSACKDMIDLHLSVRGRGQGSNAREAIKAREARVIGEDSDLQGTFMELARYEATYRALRGYRDAYKAQYDGLSRIITLKQMDVQLHTGRGW